MTVQTDQGFVPQFTQGDRMRVALRHAGVSVQEMADYLAVARNTVSTWINDRIAPSKQTLRLWALRCGVSLAWLETGQAPTGGSGPGVARSEGLEPPTFWLGVGSNVVTLRRRRVLDRTAA